MTAEISEKFGASLKPAPRVFVIGLDGASWDLLGPLMRSGDLPALSDLCDKGSWGNLVSTIPPVTASAWSSFYTGRSPGSHGVYDFRKRMTKDSTKRRWVTQSDINGPKLWDILSAQGKTVGLVNLPLTFPPIPVNGYVISGMPVPPTRNDIGLPDGIVDEIIRNTGGYISDIDLLRGASPDVADQSKCFEFAENVERALEAREKAVLYLTEKHPVDLTAVVFITCDRLSHLFWKLLVPEKSDRMLEKWEIDLREKMIDILRKTDRALGSIVSRAGNDDLIVVMSDHGFGPLDEILKMNVMLRDLGFLSFKPEAEGGLRRKIGRLLPENIKKPLRHLIPGALAHKSPDQEGHREFDPYALIDWENTRAYSGGSVEQGVFLNVKGRDPFGNVQYGAEYHKVRDELIGLMRECKHPVDRKRLFDWVEPRENVYSGERIEDAPDIIFSLRNYRMVIGEDAEPPLVSAWSQPRAGFHRREGIFVFKGPMIGRNANINDANIEDVAPTICACMGLKTDNGCDGKIIREIIDPTFLEKFPPSSADFESSGHPVPEICGKDAEDMEDLMKGLGYLN
ncbi:MAG: alkaline phosphatase family protein [bacterium]